LSHVVLRTGIVIFYPSWFPSSFNSNVVQSVVAASFCDNQSVFENSQTPYTVYRCVIRTQLDMTDDVHLSMTRLAAHWLPVDLVWSKHTKRRIKRRRALLLWFRRRKRSNGTATGALCGHK